MKRSGIALMVLCIMIGGIISYNNRYNGVDIDEESVPLGGSYQLDQASLKVINDVTQVEDMVKELIGSEDVEQINQGSLGFIRSKRYGYRSGGLGSMIWDSYAGTIEGEVGIDLEASKSVVASILQKTDEMQFMTDPQSKAQIDFPHMIAVVDVAYTDMKAADHLEVYSDFLLSWGGDLETFLLNMNDYSETSGVTDYEGLLAYSKEMIGEPKQSYFSQEDYYADIDGVVIEQLMSEQNLLLSDALEVYYSRGIFLERERLFMDVYGGGDAFEEAVRGFSLGEVPTSYLGDDEFENHLRSIQSFNRLMRTMMHNQKSEPTDVARQAAVDAFLLKVIQ